MSAIEISTFTDLLTDMAEKLGETAINTDNRRKRMINNAYLYLCSEDLWWWLEASKTSDVTTTALSYSLPDDFRAFHPRNPVQIGSDWSFLIPFEDLQRYNGTSGIVQLPQFRSQRAAYIYGTSIYFIKTAMTAGLSIKYYYYKEPTLLDTGTDVPLVPKLFREAISLLAAGNYLKSQGGPESVEGNDYLALYDQMVTRMKSEQDNRRTLGIKRRALDPEEVAVYQN